jgi:DNA polymerase III delta prime subunit
MTTLTSWLSVPNLAVQPNQPPNSGNASSYQLLLQSIPPTLIVTVALFILARVNEKRKERKAEDKDLRLKDRSVLIRRMRHYVDGLLGELVHSGRRIPVTHQAKPELVTAPWRGGADGVSVKRADSRPDASITELFDASQTLLLLGEPGGGKTTWMLELARELLKRSNAHEETPLPVVLSVLPWAETAPQRRRLDQWLVRQLCSSYGQSRGVAWWWIRNGEVALLLDDLDRLELATREAFVTQVNQYMARHPASPLVVCCRTAEYEEMSSRLQVDHAVRIEKPTRQQVYDYLESAGTSFRVVRAAVNVGDNDDALWDLLQSPLMLSVVADVFREGSVEIVQVDRAEEGPAHLFEIYISKAFGRSGAKSRWPRDKAVRWLGWLASAMERSHLSEFQLDRLERCYPITRLGRTLALPTVALASGIAWVAAIWCLSAGLEVVVYGYARQVLQMPDLPSLPSFLWSYLSQVYQPMSIFFIGACIGLVVYVKHRKLQLCLFEWSWSVVPAMLVYMALAIGLYCVNIFASRWLVWPARWIPNADVQEWARTFSYQDARQVVDRVADLQTFIAVGVTWGFLAGTIVAYDQRSRSRGGLSANAGIRRSGQASLISGLTFVLAWILTNAIYVLYLIEVQHYAIPANATPTLKNTIGSIVFFTFRVPDMLAGVLLLAFFVTFSGGGLWLQHHLFRALLMMQRRAPMRYKRFLNYTGTRSILRPTENGFIFFHYLIQQYIRHAYGPRIVRHNDVPRKLRRPP